MYRQGGFGGGGFGGGNMQALMKQAQKMQDDMAKAKAEIENSTFTGTVSGGLVEITMSGKKDVQKVTIKPEIVDPEDIEMLEDMVLAAFNDAMKKIRDIEAQKLPNLPI